MTDSKRPNRSNKKRNNRFNWDDLSDVSSSIEHIRTFTLFSRAEEEKDKNKGGQHETE